MHRLMLLWSHRLDKKRRELEERAHKLAARFADEKKAADDANVAKEQAWKRAKEAGHCGDRCAPAVSHLPYCSMCTALYVAAGVSVLRSASIFVSGPQRSRKQLPSMQRMQRLPCERGS